MLVFFLWKKKTKETIINIGTGKDYSIKRYAEIISKILIPEKKFKIKFDKTKPNGTPRKVLDVSLATNYGWKSKMKLEEAIQLTYKNFKLNK